MHYNLRKTALALALPFIPLFVSNESLASDLVFRSLIIGAPLPSVKFPYTESFSKCSSQPYTVQVPEGAQYVVATVGGGEGAGGDGGPCIPANPVCAAGGYGLRSWGGAGGLVVGNFSTQSDSTLTVLVGCQGSMNNVGSGGGGGLSGVFSGSPSASTVLIVAGGGGGGGIDAHMASTASISGGSGGFTPVTPTEEGTNDGGAISSSAYSGGIGGIGFGGGGGSSNVQGIAGTPFGSGGPSQGRYFGAGGFGGGGSGGGYTTPGDKTAAGGGGGGGMPGGNGGKWIDVEDPNTGIVYGRGYGGYGGTSYISPAVKLISSGTVPVYNSAGYSRYPAESGYVTLKFYN